MKSATCVAISKDISCCAQISIAMGLPLAAVLIKALPSRDGRPGSMNGLTPVYGTLMFLTGTLVSWPQTHNSAMFSEVRCWAPYGCTKAITLPVRFLMKHKFCCMSVMKME